MKVPWRLLRHVISGITWRYKCRCTQGTSIKFCHVARVALRYTGFKVQPIVGMMLLEIMPQILRRHATESDQRQQSFAQAQH